MGARRIVGRVFFYLLVAVIVVYTVFPFYWAVVSSLKEGSALYRVELVPTHPAWGNYTGIFGQQNFARNILNSVIVAGVVVAISLLLSVTASYALGRVEFRGRKTLLLTVLGVSMFPQVAVLSGMFELVSWLGLYDTLGSLILSYMILTLPFTTWVLTTFMRELPKELEEAALVDGCTRLRALFQVILPLAAPGMVASAIFCFTLSWNEFMVAFVFNNKKELMTFPVGLASLIYGDRFLWGQIMTGATLMSAPVLVLYFLAQRYIVTGLTAGAVKA